LHGFDPINKSLKNWEKRYNGFVKIPKMLGDGLPVHFMVRNPRELKKRYRLIFRPDEREHVVYLIAIDHRRQVYK
jgi:mRNA-degrading endonuclease RelE of RelBE toxin-antitoxin system